jgi:hypothetical protein
MARLNMKFWVLKAYIPNSPCFEFVNVPIFCNFWRLVLFKLNLNVV